MATTRACLMRRRRPASRRWATARRSVGPSAGHVACPATTRSLQSHSGAGTRSCVSALVCRRAFAAADSRELSPRRNKGHTHVCSNAGMACFSCECFRVFESIPVYSTGPKPSCGHFQTRLDALPCFRSPQACLGDEACVELTFVQRPVDPCVLYQRSCAGAAGTGFRLRWGRWHQFEAVASSLLADSPWTLGYLDCKPYPPAHSGLRAQQLL